MTDLLLLHMITLDGFFEGPNHEIDWLKVDKKFNEFAVDQLDSVDVLLFGRVTYELMASYWPTPSTLTKLGLIDEYPIMVNPVVLNRGILYFTHSDRLCITNHSGLESFHNVIDMC